MTTTIIILSVLTLQAILGGLFKAIMDTLQFHYNRSVFNKVDRRSYWDPQHSWKNKYLHGMAEYGPKFWGSTTWFVFVTDGWHLFQMLFLLSMTVSLMAAPFLELNWYWYIVTAITYRLILGGVFQLFYKKLLIKKDVRNPSEV